MIRSNSRRSFLLCASLQLALVTSAPASLQVPRGDALSASGLDKVRAFDRAERSTYLESLDISREDWLPEFLTKAATYLDMDPDARKRSPELMRSVLTGVILVELLGESDASQALRALAETPDVPEALIYAAFLALNELETDDEFIRSSMNHQDGKVARLAILAGAVRSGPAVSRQLEDVRRRRGNESEVSAAVQFIKAYWYDVGRYDALRNVTERIQFVETRLRRAYNPINGIIQSWDPHTAGHPITRWAFERWRQLAKKHPEQVLSHVQGLHDYPTPDTSPEYRRFLTDSVAPLASEDFRRTRE